MTTKTQMFTTFNNASKLGTQRIQAIKKQGEILIEADLVAVKVWEDMRNTDVSPKEAMNYETFNTVY